MKLQAFDFSIVDNVALIRLNQPDKGNPFNTPFCEEFNALSVECGENPEIRAVLISAAGPNFSVGGDLKEFLKAPEQLPATFKRMTASLHMGVARFARNDQPVILAAHNLVVGGAVALVAAADFVYAAPETRFYAAFTAIALSGDTGISHYLPRRVGNRRATEFLLLNEMWTAEKALETGLINDIVERERLDDHCMELAARLARGPTEVYGRIRRLLLSSFNQTIDTQLEMEAIGMAECARSEEALQAMSKLIKKS
jgi:2-(1,2-epoxy-1,2-dihydrophenyl)acetyl-CoA isomerase